MALATVLEAGRLDSGVVLAPERYDPRRFSADAGGVLLGEIVTIANEQLAPRRAAAAATYVVFDTGDAQEGVLHQKRAAVSSTGIGSAKKIVQGGDVIISRLRPYLRQVALVDQGLCEQTSPAILLCSTEFFVLRSHDGRSISFLVPLLLTEHVQKALAASQEGGHHPRFSQRSLELVPIPSQVLVARDALSETMDSAAGTARQSMAAVESLIARLSIPVED